jgi:hypothetical protein
MGVDAFAHTFVWITNHDRTRFADDPSVEVLKNESTIKIKFVNYNLIARVYAGIRLCDCKRCQNIY